LTLLFAENETNTQPLYHAPDTNHFVKDAFHDAVLKNGFTCSGIKETVQNLLLFIPSI
jgi:hypothetical protein